MNGELNNIFSTVKGWANAAGKKTGEVVETSKIKLKIASLSSEISKAYEQLGEMVYQAAKKNDTLGSEMDEVMDKIDSLLEEVRELESKVGDIKKVRICPNCNSKCSADSRFCSKCGVILSTMISEKVENVAEEADDYVTIDELCNDEDCCGNCRCDGDCSSCDERSNKSCDKNCDDCDCCEEDGCDCDCSGCGCCKCDKDE